MTRAYRFVPGAVYLLLAFLCLAPSGASGEVRSLTLPQAVEYALVNNGELKALRAEKEVARAGLERAVLFPNPSLELAGDTGALTGSPDENTVSIGLSQEFLTSGKRAIEEQKKYIEVHDGYLAALADRQIALARLEASVGVDFQNKTSGGAQ